MNLEDFDRINKKPAQLRKELDLPADKKIITYSGGLYENRGIEDILYCASKYENYLFLFIGGIEKQIQKYESYIHSQLRAELPNVIFTGHLKHEKIALYLKASDILVAPYSKKVETARHFSSIKLAEYAASKIPVIASDLPSITKTFAEDELTFFRPSDADDLCEKIKLVFNNYEQAEAKAEKACEKVRDFSWDKRAGKIADLFQS